MGLDPIIPSGESFILKIQQGDFSPLLIILVPALGGLIAGIIIYRLAPEAEGHGTDEAIKAFHRKRGIIRPFVPLVKLVASVISIGTGGSGGREGPIAQIGSGIGSYLSLRLGLNTQTRRWLLAAGMGAGIGSIFRAPLAGAIFAAEVLYSSAEVETEVLLPATVSSIIAYTVYSFKFGWGHIFSESGYGFSNPLELIPYSLEALVLAFAAFLFVKIFYGVRNLFLKWKIPNELKPFIGGLVVGLVAFTLITITGDRKYIISIMGGGYGILQEIFQNGYLNTGMMILLLVGFGKIITTSFTIGSGGSAGVFGPSMVIGGTLGAFCSYVLQFVFPGLVLHPSTFAIVGMAGFFAAAANTPLSTIIMVSELTGNYQLLLPSMWVVAIAYLVARRWSIYASQVEGKINSPAHFGDFAHEIFENTRVIDALSRTRKIRHVPKNYSLEQIIKLVSETRQRAFPVVDENNDLIGAFNNTDVTQALQEENVQDKTAEDIMHTAVLVVFPYETIGKAQQIMLDNQVEELFVVRSQRDPDVLNLITASDITRAYHKKLSQRKSSEKSSLIEDSSLLKTMDLEKVLEKDLLTIHPEATLGDLVKIIIKSKRNIFPVVDEQEKYLGIILLNDIRELIFDNKKYDTIRVKELMKESPAVIQSNNTMIEIMNMFEKTNAWNLPAVGDDNKFAGLISKSTIFSEYRKQLLFFASAND